MAARCRSIKDQFRHAISRQSRHRQSKHSATRDAQTNGVFSSDRRDSLEERAAQFATWMKDNHPEIRFVKDITKAHTSEWLASLPHVTGRTLDEYNSQLGKLYTICSASYKDAFSGKTSWKQSKTELPEIVGLLRTVAMNREDFAALLDSMKSTNRSDAYLALEMTSRSGLRVNECAWLSGKDINLVNNTIYVCREGAKGGRARTLPIREKDRRFYGELKDRVGNGWIFPSSHTKNGHLQADSINDTIRRHMEKIGISEKYPKTTLHTVRKMFARERMVALRGPERLADKGEEMKHFNIVAAELGHGKGRYDLYNAYVG